MTHRIELDSVKVSRNKNEYRMVPRVRWGDLEVVGDHKIIRSLAALMVEQGVSGQVEVYRGNMLIFTSQNLEDWANGRVGKGEQPEHLKRRKGHVSE